MNSNATRGDVPSIDALIALVQTELATRSTGNGATAAMSAAEQLGALAKELQAECEWLRTSLALVTQERDLYLQAAYESSRATMVQEIDFPELLRTSAGPLEFLS